MDRNTGLFTSLVAKGKLSVHFMRHVSNKNDDTEGSTDWGYTAMGFLYKE